MHAAGLGRAAVIETSLKAGANEKVTHSDGQTALAKALQYQRVEVVKLLSFRLRNYLGLSFSVL